MPGTLYLVATPIGNLADITYRAVEILRTADLIACEDTRHSRKLLQHYGITTRTVSYHEHNEQQRALELMELLKNGGVVAVISDAGTPGVSDPGFRLVQEAIKNEIPIVSVPGPSAFVTALIASGLGTDEFFFGGFLPSRSGARQARLSELRQVEATLIFYEAPHRLAATLRDAKEVLGDRDAVVARELTKLHEEVLRGRLSELQTIFSSAEKARGELVLLISRDERTSESGTATVESIVGVVDRYEQEGLDHRAALKKAAREMGLSRAEAYRRLVSEKGRG